MFITSIALGTIAFAFLAFKDIQNNLNLLNVALLLDSNVHIQSIIAITVLLHDYAVYGSWIDKTPTIPSVLLCPVLLRITPPCS